MGLGRVKTPTLNLRVEIPSRFRKFENQKCLRPLLREDDRENNSALSWLVHVFTQPGSKTEVSARPRDVCFTPQGRHQLSRLRRPFRAITGGQLISRSLVGAPFLAKASWLYKQRRPRGSPIVI